MSLRFALKEATEKQHLSVEKSLDIMSVQALPGYVEKLRRFHAFYQANEPALAAYLEDHGLDFYRSRMKEPLLERDLSFLSAEARTPQPAAPLSYNNIAEAFGALYVIEGSTLGGQLISRHLRDVFKLSAEGGVAFFSGYGPETGKKWREFCELLEIHASHDSAGAIAGAKNAFTAMEFTLTGLPR